MSHNHVPRLPVKRKLSNANYAITHSVNGAGSLSATSGATMNIASYCHNRIVVTILITIF
jgi:hypothetical protein